MRATLAAIAALLTSTAFLLAGAGLLTILVSLRAGLEGFPTIAIGAMTAAYYSGFVAGCALVPYAVRRVGHIRAFAALAAVAACVALAHGLAIAPVTWIALRGLGGFCVAGLYMIIESWLNERATRDTRGRILALYMVVNLSGITAGQMVLVAVPAAGHEPFALAAIGICIALVPVAMTGASAPAPLGTVRLRLRRLYRHSPVGAIGCLFVGLASGTFWGLVPAVAATSGLDARGIAVFMSLAIAGGAAAQWPLGRLSDRVDRRAVISGGCVAAAAAGTALAVFGPLGAISGPVLAFLLGAFLLSLYSLCVSHANDFIPQQEFVEASSGLLLIFGAGAAVGPLAAAVLMDATAPGAAFAFIAGSLAVLAAFALWRIRQREALPPETRQEFTAEPPTSPAVFELNPRADKAQTEAEIIPPEETPPVGGDDGAPPPGPLPPPTPPGA